MLLSEKRYEYLRKCVFDFPDMPLEDRHDFLREIDALLTQIPGQQAYLAQLEDFKLTKYDELARDYDETVKLKEELEVTNFHLVARVAQLEIEIDNITMQVKPTVAHSEPVARQ